MDVKVRLLDHLEGWDFAELSGDRDPFHLKVTTLLSFAARTTWVDYTRAIPAVTLFRKGFENSSVRPRMHRAREGKMRDSRTRPAKTGHRYQRTKTCSAPA